MNRLIVSETDLEADKIKTGELAPFEWEQLDHKVKTLIDAPLFVDDTAGLSVFDLRAKCRRLKKLHDIRSEEHTSELQSRPHLVCRLLLEKKKKRRSSTMPIPISAGRCA